MRNSYLKKGLYAVTFTVAAAQVNAAAPVDFSNLVEQVSPAVVSVSVVKKMTQEELLQQQVPEILRRFLEIRSLFHSSRHRKKKRDTAVHFLSARMATCSPIIMWLRMHHALPSR